MNLLHNISPGTADRINTIIEINKGSKNKYEIDKETGIIALDRVTHTTQEFPFDYGFIPQTLWDDGDALDVIVLTTHPLHPGVLVRVRPLAVMDMVDGIENDEKIIAVPIDDPRWDNVQDLKDINPHTIKEIEHFYSTYKKIQNKEVKINDFRDKKSAQEVFQRGVKMYKDKPSKK
ncbi:MAG: inorganic diphosphatase [Patescibacteria group bacterium]|nr:inorganic diphosphatase [Patescibacteria group bacterium]